MKKRIEWVDSAKAIGIFCVVLGHHRHPLYNYIYSFHIPLFFFISGFLFTIKPDTSFSTFAKRKARTLLLPYFVFSFLLFCIWIFLGKFISPNVIENASLQKNFIGIFYAQGQLEYMRWGVEMWFLPCLFLTTLIYFWLAKLSIWKQALTIFTATLLGFILPTIIDTQLPWSLDVSLVALGFVWLGQLLRNKINSVKLSWKTFLLLISCFALNVLFFTLSKGRIDMYQAIYGNYFYFYASAIPGVIFYLLLAKFTPSFRAIVFIGCNSILIFMLHMRALTLINFISERALHLNSPDNSLLVSVIISILQIAVLVPVIFIINRYFPHLIGHFAPPPANSAADNKHPDTKG